MNEDFKNPYMKNTFGTKAAQNVDGHGCTLMYYNDFWWIIIPAKKDAHSITIFEKS